MTKPTGFSIQVTKHVDEEHLTSTEITAMFKASMLLAGGDGVVLPCTQCPAAQCSNGYLDNYCDEVITKFKEACVKLGIDLDAYLKLVNHANWGDAVVALSLGNDWDSELVL